MVGMQDFLQGMLQPRLVLCIASVLATSADDTQAIQQKLHLLLNFTSQNKPIAAEQQPLAAAAAAAAVPEDVLQAQLHLLILLDLIQQLPSLNIVPVELLQQASCKLLSWVLHTAACRLCCMVLADETGGPLLQHTLQCCLAFVVGCMVGCSLQDQQELLTLLTRTSECESCLHLVVWFHSCCFPCFGCECRVMLLMRICQY
jgi:hypothetical protein